MWVFYLNDGMINFDKKKFLELIFLLFFSRYIFFLVTKFLGDFRHSTDL